MFWPFVLIVFALVSILAMNPLPFILAIVFAFVGRTAEAPYVAIVVAAGRNVDLPKPTSGAGCAAFLLAVIVFGLLGLIALGAVVGILEGAI